MKFLGIILSLLISTQAFAFVNGQIQNAPYNQTLQKLIDFAALDGQHVDRLVKVTYDFSKNGGAIGTINLGQYIPANSIMRRSYAYVVTQVAEGTGATLAITCNAANDVFTAADISGSAAGAFLEGTQSGASTAFKNSGTTQCQLKAVIAVAAITAGKVNFYVHYSVHE